MQRKSFKKQNIRGKASNKKQAHISTEEYQKSATHKQIEAGIEEYMNWMQVEGTHTDASMPFGKDGQPRPGKVKVGWPDRTYVLKPHGKMFCIEIKTEIDKLSDEQVTVISSIIASGGIVVVARSVEDVKQAYVAYMNSIKNQ